MNLENASRWRERHARNSGGEFCYPKYSIMKKLLLFVLWTGISYCQVTYNKFPDFYDVAIKNHYDNLKKSDSKLSEIDNLYFVYLDIPKGNLPSMIEGKEINYLDLYNKKNKKLLRKRLSAISIKPLTLNMNKIEIFIYNISILFKNGEYHISTGDGTKTIFEYSCEKGWTKAN